MALLLALLPGALVVLGLTLLEIRRGAPRGDWLINLQAWALYVLIAVSMLPLFQWWRGTSLLDGAALPFWAAFPIFLIVTDLGEYLFHRAQHKVPLLWSMHSLHHSDPEMSALTTNRHFWADQLIKSVTIWTATALVISPTPIMVYCYIVLSMWNFVVHANLPFDFGRFSWALNSPSYHRRHHSRLPEHYDSNFAALFPIFDLIGGSYHRPDGFPPTGLDHAPRNLREVATWPLHYAGPAKAPAADPVSAG